MEGCFHLPDKRNQSLISWVGIGKIKDIFQFEIAAGIIQQGNTFGATVDPPAEIFVPDFNGCTGNGVWTLCIDKYLLVERIFIDPAGSIQKLHPIFWRLCDFPGSFGRKRPYVFYFVCHKFLTFRSGKILSV